MKGLFKKFEDAMMAVAFAEEGEFGTAAQMMNEDGPEGTVMPDIAQRTSGRPVLSAE